METSSLTTIKDKLRHLFHEDITATMEITGGTWDAARNVYSVTDSESGVTTEYQLKKNKTVETGTSVRVHSYKESTDHAGLKQRVEVSQNPHTREWERKSTFAHMKDAMAVRPKLMGTLKTSRSAESHIDTFSLVVSPVVFKRRERPPVIVMPPNPPVQGGMSRI